MTIDYSLVVCTYNPDERLLTRCLASVASLSQDGLSTETILVDNNSVEPIENRSFVIEFGHQIPDFRVIKAEKQGLLFARIAGIEQARGRFIVFFDDDNEPHPDYLKQLHHLIANYPTVAAWGPGNVWVDFVDGINEQLREQAAQFFQERHEKHVSYACQRSLQPCYPYGTGLAVSTTCAQEYVKRVATEAFSLVGRQGQQLSSGDDTQLVLCCVATGHAAGVSPTLQVNHIIPAKRANYPYLKKLAYGMLAAYDISIKQVFAEHPINFGKPLKANWKTNLKIIRKYLKTTWMNTPDQTLKFISYLGLLSSSYSAAAQRTPWAMGWALKKMGIY